MTISCCSAEYYSRRRGGCHHYCLCLPLSYLSMLRIGGRMKNPPDAFRTNGPVRARRNTTAGRFSVLIPMYDGAVLIDDFMHRNQYCKRARHHRNVRHSIHDLPTDCKQFSLALDLHTLLTFSLTIIICVATSSLTFTFASISIPWTSIWTLDGGGYYQPPEKEKKRALEGQKQSLLFGRSNTLHLVVIYHQRAR